MQAQMTDDRLAAILVAQGLTIVEGTIGDAKIYKFDRDGVETTIRFDAEADNVTEWAFYPVMFQPNQIEAASEGTNHINVHQLSPKAVLQRDPERGTAFIRFDNVISTGAGLSDQQLIDFLETNAVANKEAAEMLNEGFDFHG